MGAPAAPVSGQTPGAPFGPFDQVFTLVNVPNFSSTTLSLLLIFQNANSSTQYVHFGWGVGTNDYFYARLSRVELQTIQVIDGVETVLSTVNANEQASMSGQLEILRIGSHMGGTRPGRVVSLDRVKGDSVWASILPQPLAGLSGDPRQCSFFGVGGVSNIQFLVAGGRATQGGVT
jgi:hypothetical protein